MLDTSSAGDQTRGAKGEKNNMAQQDPLDAACSLVGRFQYHFGRVEQKIDQAVIKLLDLDDKAGPIVTGSVDFAKKVNFVRTSAYEQARNDEDKQFTEKTCKDVFDINTVRQTVIHSSFEPAGGGVQFKRTVAKDGRVRVNDQVWGDKEFSKHYSKMREVETELDKLIELIKPVKPVGFQWYRPWQDTYHPSTPLAAHAAALAAQAGTDSESSSR
jgi:hypothetical protein